jgi:hypothetical protein
MVSHPLTLDVTQLAACAEFSQTLDELQSGENLLYGGDFEDLDQITQFDWQQVRHEAPGIDAGARLSPQSPQHGTRCLELFAAATIDAPHFIGGPPVWIVSPPVPVDEGSLVEISGWIRIDKPITGSVDGLLIFDSLGGAELSLALRETSGWQAFQLIRGVPSSSELRLTFALSGIGSACIDGVMIRVLQRPVPRRLPAVSPMDRSATNEGEISGPLFPAPATR